jgi:hypothetical protein
MDIRFGPKRRASPCFTLALAGVLLAIAAAAPFPQQAQAAEWSASYIRALPDEAFAAIEVTRHLPHHDHTGDLNLPHLRSALARWHQVRWRDPAIAAAARQHLEEHRAWVRSGRLPSAAEGN